MTIAARFQSFLVALGFVVLLSVCGCSSSPSSAHTESQLATDEDRELRSRAAERILASQAPDGSIRVLRGAVRMVIPYFANFAAIGLADAHRSDPGDLRYLAGADRWLDWYAAHMNADGTVFDFVVTPADQLVSTGDFDSTDSYASTFLEALGAR
jgi:hypothetical protein